MKKTTFFVMLFALLSSVSTLKAVNTVKARETPMGSGIPLFPGDPAYNAGTVELTDPNGASLPGLSATPIFINSAAVTLTPVVCPGASKFNVTIDTSKLRSSGDLGLFRNNGKLCFLLDVTDGGSVNCVILMKFPVQTDILSLSGPGNQSSITRGNGAEGDASKLNGGTDTSMDTDEPISLATGEYFFYRRWLDLHAPTLPLTFDLYHGSQFDSAAMIDNLPRDFACNHRLLARKATLFGGFFIQLVFNLGLGQIVGFDFNPETGEWDLEPGERWTYSV
ncbi:MAG: hypothetical protein AAF492_20970, partial [Verrucomicrobiota bacterium]